MKARKYLKSFFLFLFLLKVILSSNRIPQTNAEQLPPEKLSAPFSTLWKTIPKIYPDVMSITADDRGRVWVLTKYQLIRYENGNPETAFEVLEHNIFNKELGPSMASLSAMGFLSDGKIVVGTWEGDLYLYNGQTWSYFIPNKFTHSRINFIKENGDHIYIGCLEGLWHSSKSELLFKKIEEIPGSCETILSIEKNMLLVGGSSGLWKFSDPMAPELFWSLEKDDANIQWIGEIKEKKEYLIGTNNGYVHLDRKAHLLKRELASSSIYGVIPSGKQSWAFTWEDGIKLFDESQWLKLGFKEGLPGDSVISAIIDSHGKMWVGIYGKGIFFADANQVQKALVDFYRENPPLDSPTDGVIFKNIEEAYHQVLKDIPESGQISFEPIFGSKIFFWNGRNISSQGLASRRPDGKTLIVDGDDQLLYEHSLWSWIKKKIKVLVGKDWFPDRWKQWFNNKLNLEQRHPSGWTINIFEKGKRTLIPPPFPLPQVSPKIAFLDSRDRIWIGSGLDELFMFDQGLWTTFGINDWFASNNPITVINEDQNKHIWVGTVPNYIREKEKHAAPSIHIYNGKKWNHFSPSDPHGFWATNDICLLHDERVAIGTNGRLSIFKNWEAKNFDTSDGLIQTMIAHVSEDNSGILWLSHSAWGSGLTWYDGFKFYDMTSRDGFFSDQIEQTAHDAAGRHWILDKDGRVCVYPKSFLKEKIKIP